MSAHLCEKLESVKKWTPLSIVTEAWQNDRHWWTSVVPYCWVHTGWIGPQIWVGAVQWFCRAKKGGVWLAYCSHMVIVPCDVHIQWSRVKSPALVLHLLDFAVLHSCSVNIDFLFFGGFVVNVLCRWLCGKAWAKVEECKFFCSCVSNLFCYAIKLLTVCLISISFLQGGTLPLLWSLIKMLLLWDFCHPSRTELSFFWINLEKVVMVKYTPG